MPEQLPEECPECGYDGGWYVPDDQRIYAYEDGSLSIGPHDNNTRWGQQLKAICNDPDCDAHVNLYVEGEVVRTGQIESSGALDVIQELDDEFPKPIRVNCKSCETPFISEVDIVNSHRHKGIELKYQANCGCKPVQQLIRHKMAELEDPAELQNKLDEIKDSSSKSQKGENSG